MSRVLSTRQLQIQKSIRESLTAQQPTQATPGGTVSTFWAVVTATATSPASLSIKIAGSATVIAGIRYAASYTSPAANDVVFGIRTGTDYFVLAKRAA